MDDKKKNKNIIMVGIIICAIVLVSILGTYAYFFATLEETQNEVIKVQAGTMALTFSDNSDEINNIEKTLNFGDTVEKEFRIENTGTLDAYAKISWDDLTNTFLDGSLTYTLEYKTSEIGTYEPVDLWDNNVPVSSSGSKQLIVDHLEIPSGASYIYKIIITYNDLDVDQTEDLKARFVTKFTIEESTKKPTVADELANLGIKIQESQEGVPNFAIPATTDETKDGLFSMEDDYGMSYYYRGTAPNNYIKFGKNKAGQEMWWRIIRFNGDGSIRMQYDGVGTVGANTYTRGLALTNQVWNSNTNDAKYVGWMFGGKQGEASTAKMYEGKIKPEDGKIYAQSNETNSNIKTAVENWYKANIVDTGYSEYVADAIFCNDRSTPGQSVTGVNWDTGLGYGTQLTVYGAPTRIDNNTRPQFTCPQDNDKFTVSSEKGNEKLQYPVGLITVDEIVAAGSGRVLTGNIKYYLYKGVWYWSFTPGYIASNRVATVYGIYIDNVRSHGVDYNIGGVAPVINLKLKYLSQLKGTGIASDPYYLDI